MKKIRISELPLFSSLKGLYTIGTDNENRSVKVSLEFIETETATAVQNTETATKNATEATTAATEVTIAAKQATEASLTATENAVKATTEAEAQTALAKTATDNATAATTASEAQTALAKTATDEATEAKDNAVEATTAAQTATADLKTWFGSILPTGLVVKCLTWITKGNLAEKRIDAILTPDNAAKNVIYLSDNKSVAVDPFGRISVIGTGKSTVHVIPTMNTALAKTVIIEVGEPSLRMTSQTSMRFTSTGALRFN